MQKQLSTEAKSYIAEFTATAILVFSDAGMAIIQKLFPEQIHIEGRALAAGVTIMVLIYAFGEVSGAHMNPAVTWSFSLRKVFPWPRIVMYWLAQILGAVFASFILSCLFNSDAVEAATTLKSPEILTFFIELILTFILIFVVLATAHIADIKGPESAIPVGGTIALCSFLGKGLTGASMNPARAVGPAIVTTQFDGLWIYVVAPFAGGTLAVLFMRLLYGKSTQEEIKSAQGTRQIQKPNRRRHKSDS